MSLVERTNRLLAISGSGGIFRRYLIVNGFDGALTMLGLIIGFMVSAPTDLAVIVNACLAAAIALGMSGISSAWVSEVAEQKHALAKLEEALIFILGVLLGRVSDVSWVRSGLRTLVIAAMTITLIYLLTG